MAKIEGFRIKNYRVLQDVMLGKLWNTQQAQPLTPMTVVIGENGVGKSSLFDAFGFLADCLKLGVEEACDTRGRGGFDRIRSQGRNEPIEFHIYYKEDGNARPITYELAIDADSTGRPYVKLERLRQRRSGQSYGWPFSFLMLNEGKGVVWKGEEPGQKIDEGEADFDLLKLMEEIEATSQKEESRETEIIELQDKRKLGIATLGALKQHPRISTFRQFIEGWYLSYFTPDAAKRVPPAGAQKHLNLHGDNLGNVVQYFERSHPITFRRILKSISEKIPGIGTIEPYQDGITNNLYLLFKDKGFAKPFTQEQMSDGTLKVFAYLLLLEDPTPPPFICIEEPENGLYHKLLETLATEFRTHATGRKNAPQLFITTHQPYFVDALAPEETWVLEKGPDGFSSIRRASDDATVKAMVDEGLPLGGLWYSDYLDAR